MRKSSTKKKIKGSVDLVNHHVWNMRISPKDYTLSISDDGFVFTKDFVNINAEDNADDDEIRIVFYDTKTFEDNTKQVVEHFDTITINNLTLGIIK